MSVTVSNLALKIKECENPGVNTWALFFLASTNKIYYLYISLETSVKHLLLKEVSFHIAEKKSDILLLFLNQEMTFPELEGWAVILLSNP